MGVNRPEVSNTRQGSGRVSAGLAIRLSELARELQQDDDVHAVLSGIVQAALDLIPGTAHASISLVTGSKKVDSEVASGELPRQVDALQNSTGQGPCLDAAYQERVVRVPDLSREDRWPEFSRGAVKLGARSMLSFQLFVEGDRFGALNLYGTSPNAFDSESEQVGLLVAAHAAVAFADSQKINQLGEALVARQLIGQAEGILMERYKLTAEQAFLLLSRASSRSNIKLRDIAEHLASSGEFTAPRLPAADS
ncbi:GAF and ANTAR domain-containing protein [Arthrobacter sp. 24S4-2]|nr:GAF and ANTAR domain-containing protein [Arthrobacter sp. 24S4-2]